MALDRSERLAEEVAEALSWLQGNHPDGSPGSDAEACRGACDMLERALRAYHAAAAPRRREEQLALPLD